MDAMQDMVGKAVPWAWETTVQLRKRWKCHAEDSRNEHKEWLIHTYLHQIRSQVMSVNGSDSNTNLTDFRLNPI